MMREGPPYGRPSGGVSGIWHVGDGMTPSQRERGYPRWWTIPSDYAYFIAIKGHPVVSDFDAVLREGLPW